MSSKLVHTGIVAASLLLATFGAPSAANVITQGCADVGVSCTMQELFDGGTIQVHDKLFSNWQPRFGTTANPVFSFGAGAGASAADPNNIDVSGIAGNPMNPGIHYTANGEFSADSLTIERSFQVSSWAFEVAVVDG